MKGRVEKDEVEKDRRKRWWRKEERRKEGRRGRRRLLMSLIRCHPESEMDVIEREGEREKEGMRPQALFV